VGNRPSLGDVAQTTGKKARLRRILYQHGARNGTALFLPYDHGLEHGPRDFFGNPAADPGYVVRLAVDGDFNGVVLHIGNASKFYWDFAGEVPLILKLNGKTDVPTDDEPLSPLNATVADAVALGADAVGYTLYVGSPLQTQDFQQFQRIRADADRLGMPVMVWAYPRGRAIDGKGGRNSFYAVDYAVRVASELGADLVKITWPEATASSRPEYDREFTATEMLTAVVRSSNRSLVVLSGGELTEERDMLGRASLAMDAGATGLIFGRNIWGRERSEALRFVETLRELLAEYPS